MLPESIRVPELILVRLPLLDMDPLTVKVLDCVSIVPSAARLRLLLIERLFAPACRVAPALENVTVPVPSEELFPIDKVPAERDVPPL